MRPDRLALTAKVLVAALILPVSAEPVRTAQAAESSSAEAPPATESKPSLRAGVFSIEAAREFKLDGRLTEPAWATTDSIQDLTTIEPEEGGVPAGRTVVKVLASSSEIIFGVHCFDPDPSGIVWFSKARDTELDEEDNVLLVLDTFGDERSGFVFAVNAGGSRFDGLVTAQGDDVNSSWDTSWEAITTIDSTGWSAEIRLPIKSLNFKQGLTQWGFNLERRVQRLQESSRWSGAKRDFEIFQTSQAGHLTGLPAFHFGRGLTVRPGYVADAKRPDEGDVREFTHEFSLDVIQKMGSNLAANLTVNTDFGETESDVRQTNLSRFDLFFPEKRSFFLEGADIFEFGLGLNVEEPILLPYFSRRIGLYRPEGEDEGTEVPIIAGGGVQGRVGHTNVGALMVATDAVEDFAVPKAEMGVARISQNILAESSVGAIATVGDPLDRRNSWLAGVDFTYKTSKFMEDKRLLAGVWGLTTDREGLDDDKHAFGGKIAYPNDLYDLEFSYLRIGDGFDPSLGFVQRTGHIFDAVADYNPRPGGSLVRSLSMGISYFRALDLDGIWESYAAGMKPLSLLFDSGDEFSVTFESVGEAPPDSFDVFDSPEKTVEIVPGTYHWTRTTLLGRAAPRRKISGEVSYSFGGFYDGDLQTVDADVSLKPWPVVTLRFTTERNVARLPEGDFTQFLDGAWIELKLSPNFQVTNLTQYDNESRSLGSASRLRWSFSPLGDLFLAFNHNMTRPIGDSASWEFESDQLLAKVRYSFRL